MKIVNALGKKGEDIACELLKKKGYTLIERNFRRSYAEIDIVVTRNNTLVFVEVKTRTSSRFGSPLESITYWKLKPLIKTARYYSLVHPKLPQLLRIDAVAVVIDQNGNTVSTEHVENITGF